MEKEFLNYEQSLALKQLGFDEPCFAKYYNAEDDRVPYLEIELPDTSERWSTLLCSAPLYQQAFRWFREKHGLHYNMQVLDGKWFFERWSLDGFKTYEESELACLKKLIELVKEK